MQGFSRRLGDHASRRLRDEAGFAMIEVMVSAVLLIVLALATLSVIDNSQTTSSNNRSRDVAAQIAQNEQNKIRQMPMAQLAGGLDVTGPVPSTETGNPFDYTVHSTAEWVTDSGGAVTCSTSGNIAYLQTSTSVTWPGMGKIKPVTADAIVDPGVAALGADKGALTVLLSKADGTGTPGITVSADGQSAVTDENGCAVIGNLDIGPQTLTYSDGAHVDKDSVQSISKPVTIGAGTIAQATGYYDFPGTVTLSLVDDAAVPGTPTWPKVSVDHASRTTPTLLPINSEADGTTAVSLFPFLSKYKMFAGECYGNDPANSLYGATTPQGLLVTSGTSQTLALNMPSATVNVDQSAVVTANRGGATVVRVIPDTSFGSMTGCPATLFTSGNWTAAAGTAATSAIKLQLPYGMWKVCADYRYSNSGQGGNRWSHMVTTVGGGAGDDPLALTPASATGTYATRNATTLTMPALPNTTTNGSTPPACS